MHTQIFLPVLKIINKEKAEMGQNFFSLSDHDIILPGVFCNAKNMQSGH